MLYLDLSLKPVVKICICNLHSFVQTPICEIFMRIAIDLLKYCISDDHFQLLETSARWLGRLAYILCDPKWNVSRVFILFYSPALVFIALVLDMNKKLPFAYKLTVTYLVCDRTQSIFKDLKLESDFFPLCYYATNGSLFTICAHAFSSVYFQATCFTAKNEPWQFNFRQLISSYILALAPFFISLGRDAAGFRC